MPEAWWSNWFKRLNSWKKKGANDQIGIIEKENKEIDITDHKTLEEVQVLENSKNEEISINYVPTKKEDGIEWNNYRQYFFI